MAAPAFDFTCFIFLRLIYILCMATRARLSMNDGYYAYTHAWMFEGDDVDSVHLRWERYGT